MKALVTGGAGFIGSHLVERLLARGDDVWVVDNFTAGKRSNLAPFAGSHLEVVEADIRDASQVRDVAAGCEVIFHEAAIVSVPYSVEHPQETHDVNIQGTLNVLEAARHAKVRRLIFATSAAVYGDAPGLPKHEGMVPTPISPYGVEKLAGEYYLGVFARLYGVETVALRYFNVFGPRQDRRPPTPASSASSQIARAEVSRSRSSAMGMRVAISSMWRTWCRRICSRQKRWGSRAEFSMSRVGRERR